MDRSSYAPFDPELSIAGKPIRFILDKSNPDKFKGEHFKFLGNFIHYDLDGEPLKTKIKVSMEDDLRRVDQSLVNGFMKAWLYQYYVLQRLTWPFFVHQFNLGKNFVTHMESTATKYLKLWIGITRSSDNGVLYRSKENFGLGLTSVLDHFTRMQIVQCQLLSKSPCEDVKEVYTAKAKRENNGGYKFRATRLNQMLEEEAKLNLLFPTQPDRKGLGAGRFNAHPSKSQVRKLISTKGYQLSQEVKLKHSHQLCRQSAWIQWKDKAEPFDLSWKNLIYGIDSHIIKFVIHAAINWVTTPDLLIIWGKIADASCPLCGHNPCSTCHILTGCKFSLNDTRYLWRHDSVLVTLMPALERRLQDVNSRPSPFIPHISRSFVKAGEKRSNHSKPIDTGSLFDGARDWMMKVDTEFNRLVFPPEIYSTPQRPDIVIWSASIKVVLLLELTCPAEENFDKAHLRKEIRYSDLCREINKSTGWRAHHHPFEVGARGFVARSTRSLLSRLGFSSCLKSSTVKNLSSIVARASYTIFLARFSKEWDRKRALLTPRSKRDNDVSGGGKSSR